MKDAIEAAALDAGVLVDYIAGKLDQEVQFSKADAMRLAKQLHEQLVFIQRRLFPD